MITTEHPTHGSPAVARNRTLGARRCIALTFAIAALLRLGVAGNQITGTNSETRTVTAGGAGTPDVTQANTARSVTVKPAAANCFAPGAVLLTSTTVSGALAVLRSHRISRAAAAARLVETPRAIAAELNHASELNFDSLC